MSEDPLIQRAVRRTVGIATLRRLRRMVDAEQALEADKLRWARRLSIFFLLVLALALASIMIR